MTIRDARPRPPRNKLIAAIGAATVGLSLVILYVALPRSGQPLVLAGASPSEPAALDTLTPRLGSAESSLAIEVSPAPTQTASSGGLSETEAIAAARSFVAHGEDAEVWATMSGPFGDVYQALAHKPAFGGRPLSEDIGPTRQVWGVQFRLDIDLCDPAGSCEIRAGLRTIVIDYDTGEWLRTSTFPPPPGDTLPTPEPREFVRDGDTVSAMGYVIQQADSSLRICELAIGIPEAAPACAPVAAELKGVLSTSLPGWHQTAGVWLSTFVELSGVWIAPGIAVESVTETVHPPTREVPVVPRDPPSIGWNLKPGTGLAREHAGVALGRNVDSHSDLYSGIWAAGIPGGDRAHATILVVGVTGSLDDASAVLRAIYPYDLCLISAEFSASELDHLAHDLAATSPDWTAWVDSPTDRVRLALPVIDHPTVEMLAAFPTQPIDLDPLVRPN